MLWGWPSWTFLRVKGQWEVKFSKSEFLNSDCRFGYFAKKNECKVCFFFFDILIRTQSNSRSKSQNQGKFKQMNNLRYFDSSTFNLTLFWSVYKKKKQTLLSYFFAKNPNQWSEFKNSDIENLTSHWPLTLKKVHESQPRSILTALTTFTGQFQSRIPAIPWEFLKKANSVGGLIRTTY